MTDALASRPMNVGTAELPACSLAAQWNPGEVESGMYQRWVDAGYFTADAGSDKPPFCIVIPPPNVTGGQGRHAIRLAKFGADVAGVDASPGMIERAKANARDQSVQVSWIHSDMRHVESDPVFDCVICLGGSFGYFGRSGDRSFLSTLLGATDVPVGART